MKTVRLENNFVVEIIPEYALPVKTWYGAEFASKCVEAPDVIAQGWKYNAETKTFSDPSVRSVEELRAAALERISGKCSAAIYSGANIGGKHYSFTQTAQGNIKGMLIEAQSGKTIFLYCADGEPLTAYTADQIKEIAQVMGEWINVNTGYYEQLKTWINRETDEVVLSTIHYGSQLPNDLMQELVAKLASVCVDITKYASMLGVDK